MGYDRQKVIDIAVAELGYIEKASNKDLDSKTANAGYKNYTKYARDLDALGWFYNGPKQSYPYCDVGVDWAFVQAYGVEAAMKLLCQTKRSAGAGCVYSAQYYRNANQFHARNPQAGDQIFFGEPGDEYHTGLVEKVDSSYVYTVEWNTSSGTGVDADGGGVYRKKYKLGSSSIAGYGRPKYDDGGVAPIETAEYIPSVLEWQKAAIADGFKFPLYGADGEWGAECAYVASNAIVMRRSSYTNKNLTRIVQKVVGVDVDGLCGPDTEAAIRAYQKKHGLYVDGEVGINTWKEMLKI